MTKKVKIERKPMKVKRTRKISEEQRAALRKRMIEMRKKRKPAEYKNISKIVLALPDDDTYSFKNVKEWISHNKTVISSLNSQAKNREINEINIYMPATIEICSIEKPESIRIPNKAVPKAVENTIKAPVKALIAPK